MVPHALSIYPNKPKVVDPGISNLTSGGYDKVNSRRTVCLIQTTVGSTWPFPIRSSFLAYRASFLLSKSSLNGKTRITALIGWGTKASNYIQKAERNSEQRNIRRDGGVNHLAIEPVDIAKLVPGRD